MERKLEIAAPTPKDYFWAQRLVDSIQKDGKKKLSPKEQNFFLYETALALNQLNQASIRARIGYVELVVSEVLGISQDPKVNERFVDRYKILLGQALNIPGLKD